ncbi:MAG: antibiotic biosynthesis monooxygenase [bacterium]|nr:antibiotic biosynthesis monooxygenase [bacterium]MDE0289146.1 antibiotic biosynthesis monooxygenase [bacterium]MDE0438648.1 antibiotic biosynthesis monooxygenase [bacterium]
MIRTFIDLPLAEGGAEHLLPLFRRFRVLEVCVSQQGCRSAELAIAEDGSRAVATAIWADHDAYSRWLDHPDRARFGGATADLLDTPVSGGVTGARVRIAHVARSSGGKTGRGEESR